MSGGNYTLTVTFPSIIGLTSLWNALSRSNWGLIYYKETSEIPPLGKILTLIIPNYTTTFEWERCCRFDETDIIAALSVPLRYHLEVNVLRRKFPRDLGMKFRSSGRPWSQSVVGVESCISPVQTHYEESFVVFAQDWNVCRRGF